LVNAVYLFGYLERISSASSFKSITQNQSQQDLFQELMKEGRLILVL